MNLYQELIRQLLERKANGEDIGNAIPYCSQNAWELQTLHDQGTSVHDIVLECLKHK